MTPEWENKLGKGQIQISMLWILKGIINKTQKSELLTNDIIREILAIEKGVQVPAVIPTGVYLRIHYFSCRRRKTSQREQSVTPYWSVLKP